MIDERLKLTPEQEKLFLKFEKAMKDMKKAGVYLLPWDEAAYPVNMKHVEHICPKDFMKGDRSKYLQFHHGQLGIDLAVPHESCYINTTVCIRFRESQQ